MDFARRWEKLRKLLEKERLDIFLTVSPYDIFYLTGLWVEGAIYFSLSGIAYLITDSRFKYEIEEKLPPYFKIIIRKDILLKEILRLYRRKSLKYIGLEKRAINISLFEAMRKEIPARYIKGKDLIVKLRMFKDEFEILKIKKAISIAQNSINIVTRLAKRTISEKELSDRLEYEMRKKGARKASFDIIVAAGAHSALPHAQPRRNKIISPKDGFLLVDWGAFYQGYNSDLTRLIFFAKIPTKIRRFYCIVKEAQERAIENIKVGVSVSSVHEKLLKFFQRNGVAEYFLHNTGHGIGIEIHEPPYIGKNNNEVFQEGMVFTIEPGLYKKGLGGVRLEDIFLLKAQGIERLSNDSC